MCRTGSLHPSKLAARQARTASWLTNSMVLCPRAVDKPEAALSHTEPCIALSLYMVRLISALQHCLSLLLSLCCNESEIGECTQCAVAQSLTKPASKDLQACLI